MLACLMRNWEPLNCSMIVQRDSPSHWPGLCSLPSKCCSSQSCILKYTFRGGRPCSWQLAPWWRCSCVCACIVSACHIRLCRARKPQSQEELGMMQACMQAPVVKQLPQLLLAPCNIRASKPARTQPVCLASLQGMMLSGRDTSLDLPSQIREAEAATILLSTFSQFPQFNQAAKRKRPRRSLLHLAPIATLPGLILSMERVRLRLPLRQEVGLHQISSASRLST